MRVEPGIGVCSSALWGRGGRGILVALVAAFALAVPLAAGAQSSASGPGGGTYVAPSLLKQAKESPGAKLDVIIESSAGTAAAQNAFAGVGSLHRRLDVVDGVAVTIPAARLDQLRKISGLTITPDASVHLDAYSAQLWPYADNFGSLWGSVGNPAPQAPTIAVVDSGIDAGRTDFGGRVLADVNLTTLPNNSPGDGRGHGTMVSSIAAGSAAAYAGAAPNAKIVSLDVMDDSGLARTSDVIAACQWILANKDADNIRVANFSLHSATPSNFARDPLDKAVEQLWFHGVTVVAAAGNYAVNGQPSGVKSAPGNDPFVITVGAADLHGTLDAGDDTIAPWSSFGYTYDGFAKPELSAAGRYMVGAVPPGSTLYTQRPDHVVAPGYMQLSGTSFAAPVVAGAAAQILARHPSFTPDQVKGALMATARRLPLDTLHAGGAGEISAVRAASLATPPNPNKALDQFVAADGSGGVSFNASAWTAVAKANVGWDSISWQDIGWDASAVAAIGWSDVSWEGVSLQDVSLTDVSLGDVSLNDISLEDAAEADALAGGGYALDPALLAAAQAGTLR